GSAGVCSCELGQDAPVSLTAHPAPIDPERLAPALEPFGHSHALPSEAYTSPEVFEWELEHFFDASWLCLGRAGARHRHPSSGEWRGGACSSTPPAMGSDSPGTWAPSTTTSPRTSPSD